tara:strand:+ start:20 stop:481 length:462 start_codon:yes stop_codon:yes gene_type:complete
MYVAKINDSTKIVEDVMVMNRNKMIDNSTGKVTQARAQAVCENMFGAGTYKVKLLEMKGIARPSAGDFWHEAEEMFVAPRPVDGTGADCTSWTLNTTSGVWVPPHQCDEKDRAMIEWIESSQIWRSKTATTAGGDYSATWWHWDTGTNAWVEQ